MDAIVRHDKLDDIPRMRLGHRGNHPNQVGTTAQVYPVDDDVVGNQ
jgi:hypothetical protein